MARTPEQAISTSRGYSKSGTVFSSACLRHVRSAYGLGPDVTDSNGDGVTDGIGAKQEYVSIPEPFRHDQTTLARVPRGAPLFFTSPTALGRKYGHVALYLGGGKMLTNAAGGKIVQASVADWVAKGYKIIGWSEQLNDVVIPWLSPNLDLGARPIRWGSVGKDVGQWQRLASAIGPALGVTLAGLVDDDQFGDLTEAYTEAVQEVLKVDVDGVVFTATLAAANTVQVETPPPPSLPPVVPDVPDGEQPSGDPTAPPEGGPTEGNSMPDPSTPEPADPAASGQSTADLLRALWAALVVALKTTWPPLRAAIATALWDAFGSFVTNFKATSLPARRTFIPSVTGAFVGWLASRGLHLPAGAEGAMTTALIAIGMGGWYRLVAILERSKNKVAARAGKILVGGGVPPTYAATSDTVPVK